MTSIRVGESFGTNLLPTRRSLVSGLGLALLLCLLPIHSLVIAVLFGALHQNEATVRTIASWKEITVVLVLAATIARSILGKTLRVAINAVDFSVLSLMAISAVFLLVEDTWFRAGIPFTAQLYGFRESVFFMLLYFVGRATPELASDWTLTRRLFWLLLATSIIAILERLFVTPEMLVLLGVSSYFQDFLNAPIFTVQNVYGLPSNYWSLVGGVAFRRVGSVYLASQGFAVPFLLLLPASTAWVFRAQHRRRILWIAGYLLIWVALFLTVTRMTIITCILQTALYLFLMRRPLAAVWTFIASAAAIVVAVAIIPGLLGFIWQTLTWQTGSSGTHLKDWTNGIVAIGARPWGSGLGTSDLVATRFGLTPLTADNQFLKYGVELGVAGLIAHLAILGGILTSGWRLFKSSAPDSARFLGLVMAIATLGIFLNGMTAVVFNSLVLSYVYFWLAGTVVTVNQIFTRRAAAGSAPEVGPSADTAP